MAFFLFGFFIFLLVSLSEQALVRLSAHDLEALRGLDEPAAKRIVRMAEKLRSSLAALLLARVLITLLLGVFSIHWMLQSNRVKTALFQFSESQHLPGWMVWGVLTLAITLAITLSLWGLQKIDFLKDKSGRISFLLQRLGIFMVFWKTVFAPFIYKAKKAEQEQADNGLPTEPDLSPAGASEKREMELLKSIVQFGDVTVKQVMQPRSKVVAVDFRTTFPELLNTVCEAEFSRMPVIDDDLDNVTGILYVKDLVSHLNKPPDFEWQTAYYVGADEYMKHKKYKKQEKQQVAQGGMLGTVTENSWLSAPQLA